MKIILSIGLVLLSFFKIELVYAGVPDGFLWGNSQFIEYHGDEHVWVNSNNQGEYWRHTAKDPELRKKLLEPERVPEKKETRIKLDPDAFLLRKNPALQLQAAIACAVAVQNRRFVLVNVEENINQMKGDTTHYRLWPHLGLLFVGTAAEQEGYDVVLHDENVSGYVDLEAIVQPGDIVGLGLIVSGIERGISLARQAKRLGASAVIAGNDSAMFRADQILGLSDHPIDAVFTSNSLTAIREFLRQAQSADISQLSIPGVAVVPAGVNLSNERDVLKAERTMRAELRRLGRFDPQDVFIVPNLNLYPNEYWQKVWDNYRRVFGHKHRKPNQVRNGLALFAQGCTRTGMADVCSYCTIAGVADIRFPAKEYLAATLEKYRSFGIDYFFNTTDSAFEMRNLMHDLKSINAFFPEGLMLYGRAWGLAHHPDLLDEWLSLTGGRLMVNVGMDSGDERILDFGVLKASQSGSRLAENRKAVENLAASGAHLHYSLIFGSPGETHESCKRTLEFFEWTRTKLGTQLDQCETDIFWLNHGAPASRVFHDYDYARQLASLAGKDISQATWQDRFHSHRDSLFVPWECEQAWYECFTSITVEEAQEYCAHVTNVMANHQDVAPGRRGMGGAFKPTG